MKAMKILLTLSTLGMLASPLSVAGGVMVAAEDTASSSSSDANGYTITYYYNLQDLTSKDGKTSLGTETETVKVGDTCKEYNKYYTVNDTATVWYGTYTFLGWFMSAQNDAESFDAEIVPDSNLTLYAHWESVEENEYISALRKSETKAQLYYTYTVDNGSYEISNLSLRFGGFAEQLKMAALLYNTDTVTNTFVSRISTYGVFYTTTAPSEKGFDGSFVDALKSRKYSSTELGEAKKTKGNNSQFDPSDLPAYCDKDGNEGSYDYCRWNVFINVGATSIDKTVYATAYLKLTNGVIIYFPESSYSVKSIAAKYLADTTATYTQEVKDTLTLLSKGQVSGTVNA